jgi:hypothetical protein
VQQLFWRAALPEIARVPPGTTVILAAPHVTNWDTLYAQPQVESPSIVRLALLSPGIRLIVAYRPDLQACGEFDQHLAGARRLVTFGVGGVTTMIPQARIPYRLVEIFSYGAGTPPSVRRVRGRFHGEQLGCSLRSDALLKPARMVLSTWGKAVTER